MSDNITDFFAAPRKAKIIPTKKEKVEPVLEAKDETIEKTVAPTIEEKSNELKNDLEQNQTKERYRATPKKKVERKFDTYVRKPIQINENDVLFLNSIEKSIAFARKKVATDYAGTNRITANTIIRLVLEQFCKKAESDLEKKPNLFEKLQTEESIQDWIKKL